MPDLRNEKQIFIATTVKSSILMKRKRDYMDFLVFLITILLIGVFIIIQISTAHPGPPPHDKDSASAPHHKDQDRKKKQPTITISFPRSVTDIIRTGFIQVEGTPQTMRGKNGIRWVKGVDCAKDPCVAITFDDGPGKFEHDIFTTLANTNTPATFFYLGRYLSAHPEVAAAAKKVGVSLAGHSWNHPQLTKLALPELHHQIDGVMQLITQNAGYSSPWFRPPYGAQNSVVLGALRERQLYSVLWDIDTLDWKNRNVEETTRLALEAQPGSIILMHSIHPSTKDSVPGIINGLRSKGYILVSLDQLLEGKNIPPGATIISRDIIRP